MPTYNNGYKDSDLIHVRKTVAFAGGVGTGAVGTVALFTITGRVIIEYRTAFCTETLEEAAPTATLEWGTASDTDALAGSTNATTIVNNDWWYQALSTAGAGGTSSALDNDFPIAVSESLIFTVGAQNVTNGTLVLDLWWRPVSADGALVAA